MVGGTTNCPGVFGRKKSKDSSLLIEMSQTSPLSFEDTEHPLTEQIETLLAGKKKKKKKKKSDDLSVHEECGPSTTSQGPGRHAVTVNNPDPIITKVTQDDREHICRRKKKKHDKKLPEQEVDLTAPEPDMLENIETVNQDCSEGVPELTKRKKRHRKIRSTEPEARGEDYETAHPTEHNTDSSLETATLTTAKHCTESSCLNPDIKPKVKKRRTEQPSGPPEVTAASDVGEMSESHQNEENVALENDRGAKRKTKKAKRKTKKRHLDRGTGTAENSLGPEVPDTKTQGEDSLPSSREETELQNAGMDKENDTRNSISEEMQRLIEELKEFIPNIESRSPGVIRRLLISDLPRFKAFKSQGIPLRSGRFTGPENKRLKENVLDFLALTGIESTTHLFFPKLFEAQKTFINKQKKHHKFYEKIAEGIPRPWRDVYCRGRRMFHEYRNKGKFTEDELRSLKKLQKRHGNNWATISSLMDRSDWAVEKRFAQIASQKGSWSQEETDRFMEAMKDILQTLTEPDLQSQMGEKFILKEKLMNGIPWKSISEIVETRSWTQCRVKWMCFLKSKMVPRDQTQNRNRKKDIQAKVDLIRRLYERQVEDIADVDWEELATASGTVTPYHAQKLFFRLKVTRVPLWEKMTFCEIIDFLYDKALPVLESLVKDPNVNADVDLSERPHNHFLLSEIFGVETEEDIEVDNIK
ncbi:transcription termination factor 1-like [Osmerus eperlanus]|uniref:transcription termination factor 1-like n=1 Tax=Osmerus eperlanus TaxID=29151 RepID=UPI002E116DBC